MAWFSYSLRRKTYRTDRLVVGHDGEDEADTPGSVRRRCSGCGGVGRGPSPSFLGVGSSPAIVPARRPAIFGFRHCAWGPKWGGTGYLDGEGKAKQRPKKSALGSPHRKIAPIRLVFRIPWIRPPPIPVLRGTPPTQGQANTTLGRLHFLGVVFRFYSSAAPHRARRLPSQPVASHIVNDHSQHEKRTYLPTRPSFRCPPW